MEKRRYAGHILPNVDDLFRDIAGRVIVSRAEMPEDEPCIARQWNLRLNRGSRESAQSSMGKTRLASMVVYSVLRSHRSRFFFTMGIYSLRNFCISVVFAKEMRM
jgi:hypothetical protein